MVLVASSETSEESLVGGKAGEEVCSVFGELPALGFLFKVVENERPIERRRPVGNSVALVDPGLVISYKCHVRRGIAVYWSMVLWVCQ